MLLGWFHLPPAAHPPCAKSRSGSPGCRRGSSIVPSVRIMLSGFLACGSSAAGWRARGEWQASCTAFVLSGPAQFSSVPCKHSCSPSAPLHTCQPTRTHLLHEC